MNKYMKNSLIATIIFPVVSVLFFLAFANAVASQNPINVNLSVRQPVSPFLNDFAAQFQGDPADGSIPQNINAMLVNNTSNTYRVKLSMRIERLSPAPLSISTKPDYQPAAPIILGPRQSLNLDQNLKNTAFSNLNIRDMIFENTSLEELRENGLNVKLPEGLYRVCVDAYDFDSQGQSRLLSSRGMTCATFYICYTASPPSFFLPFASSNYGRRGSVLDTLKPNAGMIQFGWNRSTTTCGYPVGQLEYEFEVRSIYPGQTINDTKFNTPVFKKNLRTLTFNFSTSMYPDVFQDGKSYVATVKAIPVMRGSDSPVEFANRGESEPISFIYKDKKLLSGGPIKDPIFTFNPEDFFFIGESKINGKLSYKFKDDKNNELPYFKSSDGEVVFNKNNISTVESQPLSNRKISLVVAYIADGEVRGLAPRDLIYPSFPNGWVGSGDYKVISTTTTDAQGNFSFNFSNMEKDLGKGVFNATFGEKARTGNVYKVLRIRVEDGYYASPDVNIVVKPFEEVDLGEILSYVKSYDLSVYVKPIEAKLWRTYFTGGGVPLVQTALLRRPQNKPSSVPVGEEVVSALPKVFPRNDSEAGIGKDGLGLTDKNGKILFKHLVQHNPDNLNDRYYINCINNENVEGFAFVSMEKGYYPKKIEKKLWSFPFHKKQDAYQGVRAENEEVIGDPSFYEDITWNFEFQVRTHDVQVDLFPLLPRIFGQVRAAFTIDGGLPDASVLLYQKYKKSPLLGKPLLAKRTDENGWYEFNIKDVEYGDLNAADGMYQIDGPETRVIAMNNGYLSDYRPGKDKFKPPMKFGEQQRYEHFLDPDGLLLAIIVGEDGEPVPANGIIDGIFSYHTLSVNKKETIIGQVPHGNRTIRIVPDYEGYVPLDTVINIREGMNKGTKVTLVLKKNQKRIRFQIRERQWLMNNATGRPVPSKVVGKPLAGIPVSIDLPDGKITKISNKDGWVSFVFSNGGSNFKFKIEPPDDINYEVATYSLTGVEDGLEMQTYPPALLSKTVSIEGKVTHGIHKQPLEAAIISFGSRKLRWESTETNSKGDYQLKKIPVYLNNIKLYAGKAGKDPNLITESKYVNLVSDNKIIVNYNLLQATDFIVEDLFGFSVQIDERKEEDEGGFSISGFLVNIQDETGNKNFKLDDDIVAFEFSGIRVTKIDKKEDGIPIAFPVEDYFYIHENSLSFTMHDKFRTIQKAEDGKLLVVRSIENKGQLMGKMMLAKESFTFPKDVLNFSKSSSDALQLTIQPGLDKSSIPSLTKEAIDRKKFGIYPVSGKKFSVKYHDFDLEVDIGKSWIQDSTLNMRSAIQITGIPLMSPELISLDAGDFIVRPDKIEKIEIDEDQSFSFKLEEWEFEGKGWSIEQKNRQLKINSGVLKTDMLNIRANNIYFLPGELVVKKLDMENLKIGEVIEMTVLTNNTRFGYNSSCSSDKEAHYGVLIKETGNKNPAVMIESLPGMKKGDSFKFQSISLFSNKYQALNTGSMSNKLTLYQVVDVTPSQFIIYKGLVMMNSVMDLGLPQVAQINAWMGYTDEGSGVEMEFYPIDFKVEGPGRVKFFPDTKGENNPQILSEGLFRAVGVIYEEKEGINLKGTLYKTPDKAYVKVEPAHQIMPLGNEGTTELADIIGEMKVIDDEWDNFRFSGEMKGFTGIEGNLRKKFVVVGSVNADDEKIEVSDIESPFGNIKFVYKIKNARFMGFLKINMEYSECKIDGTAQFIVDANGWYFLAGAAVTVPAFGDIEAGILIGDYINMPDSVKSTILKYAYNQSLPEGFDKKISGFFITGEVPFNFLFPSIDLNLVIITLKVGAEAGIDARIWMSFGEGSTQFGFGAMAFLHIYATGGMDIGFVSICFSGDLRVELGLEAIIYLSNPRFTLNGCASIELAACVEVCELGGLNCDSAAGGVGGNMKFSIDTDGGVDLSFGEGGNCSGQPPLGEGNKKEDPCGCN